MTKRVQSRGAPDVVRADGQPVRVGANLGSGGQGDVYAATVAGSPAALKWYHAQCATSQQRRRLVRLVEHGPPGPGFLWPTELVEGREGRSFGYLMPLRPNTYHSVVELLAGNIDVSFRALANAGTQLANSFLDLHSQGLCYGDISFGNVFIDTRDGSVLICDNDNVVPDRGREPAILGTPRFMAPEIVRGEAIPSSDTDRYSLAVLLFYMLMVGHPLEGEREVAIRCMDLPAMERLYGHEPLFVFDPDDSSNRPTDGVHDHVSVYWGVYPQFLRDLFVRAFTTGLRVPSARVRESEWRRAFSELRDALFECRCGADNFYDRDRLRTAGSLGCCWRCGSALSLPPRLRLDDRVVTLTRETVLLRSHLQPAVAQADEKISACVELDARGRFVLQNLTGDTWNSRATGGQLDTIRPGEAAVLTDGQLILFGESTAEVRL